jgi:hypothetical protein
LLPLGGIIAAMKYACILAASGLFISSPSMAEIKSQSETGFISGHNAEVLAKPADVWKRLITPKDWWSAEHSWSGNSTGFSIDPKAGGCFCEIIHDKAADGTLKPRGSVEHMRVIFADPNKVLRMQGALGPLQSEAVIATLTVAMEPIKTGSGTRLSFSYVVGGGYARFSLMKIAPSVDAVLAEQFASLIKPLGKVVVGEAKSGDDWKLDPEKLEDKKPDEKAKAAEEKPELKKPAEKPKPKVEKTDTTGADDAKDSE